MFVVSGRKAKKAMLSQDGNTESFLIVELSTAERGPLSMLLQ